MKRETRAERLVSRGRGGAEVEQRWSRWSTIDWHKYIRERRKHITHLEMWLKGEKYFTH